jgi:hypothetical protein
MLRYTLPLLLLFFPACRQGSDQGSTTKPDLRTKLPGVWETTYLQIKVDSYHNTDSSFVYTVESADWVKKLGVQPYQFAFDDQHHFTTEYRNQAGVLIKEEKGIWNAFGDTLMLIRPDVTLQYLVALRNGEAYFTGLVDWDSDGLEDDAYFSIQRFRPKK